MTNITFTSKFWVNLIGLTSAVFLVTGLHFYQVFVNPNYQFISPLYFLNPKNLQIAVFKLTHHSVLPSNPQNLLPKSTIKVDCQNDCFFLVNEVKVPAIVSHNASGRLKQLELKFFDSSYGLIGYQSQEDFPIFYVINTNADLLQTIQLNLDNRIHYRFVQYYPDSQQMLFSSKDSSYLYSATKPELFKLKTKI